MQCMYQLAWVMLKVCILSLLFTVMHALKHILARKSTGENIWFPSTYEGDKMQYSYSRV